MDPSLGRKRDLLFKQRVKDDGGTAGILEPLDRINVVPEWRGTGDERVGQSKTEIGSLCVHVSPPNLQPSARLSVTLPLPLARGVPLPLSTVRATSTGSR